MKCLKAKSNRKVKMSLREILRRIQREKVKAENFKANSKR